MQAFGSSIRSRLLLLVLAATLPMLLFSAVLLRHAYHVGNGLLEETALSTARRVALTVDGQIGRAQAVGYALAELPAGGISDFDAFERAATRALAAAGLESGLVLIGRDGDIVAHTAPGGGAPAQADEMALVQRVFETGQAQVSGLVAGANGRVPGVEIHVPVIRDGAVRYDAALIMPAQAIGASLAPQALPEHWFASIVDRTGRIIYDTGAREASIGLPITDSVAGLTAQQQEGVGVPTARGRGPVLFGFTRSERTGWLVGVGVPQAVIRGPQWKLVGALTAGGAAVLAASLVLAWLIGRSITRPLRALARAAIGLGRKEVPSPRTTRGLAEAEAATWALNVAAQEMQKRDAERDATLRRAEESEARLLLAQEVGAIGVWETDLETGRRTWSQQQYALYGRPFSAGPPHGDAWLPMVHPDDRERVAATLERARSQPMSYQQEFRIIQPGGTVRWLRSAGRSEFEDGRAVRLLGTTVDVTERYDSERALRDAAARLEAEVSARTRELAESEQRFRTYFEYSEEALLVVRVEQDRFVFETINRSGERLFGMRHRDVAGKTPAELLPPETVPAVVAGYREAAATGRPLTLERTLAFPSGSIDLETVLVPVRDPVTQTVTRIISGSRDLTERKRLESRLAHAQRLEAVGQLTGGVAHDFNNLLTVVIGNLSLLRRRLGNDERAVRYLTSVEAAAERGAKLTASLLAFSRRQTLQVEGIDVGARIRDSTTLLRRALGEEIDFNVHITPDLPLANADAAQLEAAVLNLVINARDAIEAGMAARAERTGSLRIEVNEAVLRASDLESNEEARAGRFVAIEVRDSGIGMSPSVRASAFEPFFTTKEVGHGTGLGLSQVFGFVRQLGGHVTLDSTQGQGTGVVMYLPVAQSTPPERAAAPTGEPAALPPGATVLVVEDDAGIRDITVEVLRDAGLCVLSAPDGPSALDILRGPERVELLFSDVVMPGGATGVDLARAARALRPDLAVLLTSGYGGPALSRFGAESEFEVLAKPYTRSVLLQRVGGILAAVPAR